MDSERNGLPGKRESSRLPKWMTKDLIQETMRVWSARLGRHVADSEAIEMLNGVKRLAKLVREWGSAESA